MKKYAIYKLLFICFSFSATSPFQRLCAQVGPNTLTIIIPGHNPNMAQWYGYGNSIYDRITSIAISDSETKDAKLLAYADGYVPDCEGQSNGNYNVISNKWAQLENSYNNDITANPPGMNTVLVWDWEALSTSEHSFTCTLPLTFDPEWVSISPGYLGTTSSAKSLLSHLLMGDRDGWWNLFSDGRLGEEENKIHIISYSRGTVVASELMEMLLKGETSSEWRDQTGGLMNLPDDIQVTYLDPHDWGFADEDELRVWTDAEVNRLEDPNDDHEYRGIQAYPENYEELSCIPEGIITEGYWTEPPSTPIMTRSAVEGWKRKNGFGAQPFYETYYQRSAQGAPGNLWGRRVRGSYCKFIWNSISALKCLRDISDTEQAYPNHGTPNSAATENSSKNMGHAGIHSEWYITSINNSAAPFGYNYSYLGSLQSDFNRDDIKYDQDNDYFRHLSSYHSDYTNQRDAFHYGLWTGPKVEATGLSNSYVQQPKFDFINEGLSSHFSSLNFNFYGWKYFGGDRTNLPINPPEEANTNPNLILDSHFIFEKNKESLIFHDFSYVPKGSNFLSFELNYNIHPGRFVLAFDQNTDNEVEWETLNILDTNLADPPGTDCGRFDIIGFCKFYVDISHLQHKTGRFIFYHQKPSDGSYDVPTKSMWLRNVRYEKCLELNECVDGIINPTGGGVMNVRVAGPDHLQCSTNAYMTVRGFRSRSNQNVKLQASSIDITNLNIVRGSAYTFSTNTIKDCAEYFCTPPEWLLREDEDDISTIQIDSFASFDISEIPIQEDKPSRTISFGNEFELYPVPASEKIFISIEIDEIAPISFAITTIDGQFIKLPYRHLELTNGAHELPVDISDLNSGTYFMTYSSRGVAYSKKFIKME